MIENVNEYVDFLIKHDITQDQFLLCYLLYTDSQKQLPDGRRVYIGKSNKTKERPIAKMYEYIDHIQRNRNRSAWTAHDVDVLIDRGFLRQPANVDKVKSPDLLILEDKFIDAIFTTDDEFEIFWNTYPGIIENFKIPNGKMIKLKAVDKDELRKSFKKIVTTKNQFEFLMENLQWAIDNNIINMNIKNYLTSRQWQVDNEYRQQKSTNKSNYGLDEA